MLPLQEKAVDASEQPPDPVADNQSSERTTPLPPIDRTRLGRGGREEVEDKGRDGVVDTGSCDPMRCF